MKFGKGIAGFNEFIDELEFLPFRYDMERRGREEREGGRGGGGNRTEERGREGYLIHKRYFAGIPFLST